MPEKGDVVWLDFSPQAGHEQSGRRPALVLSPASYNGRTSLAICCPITSRLRRHLFAVPIPDGSVVAGSILADQMKSIDWRECNAEFVGTISGAVLEATQHRIAALLGL